MDAVILDGIIAIIREERQRRISQLENIHPDFANTKWKFEDEPFINELCLMLLVTLRHQFERECVFLAARAADDGKEISFDKYKKRIEELRDNRSWNWKEIRNRLGLGPQEEKPEKVLRLLSNLYKHDLWMKPDDDFLRCLNLDNDLNYASLPESDAVREGLANLIGLKKNADYCDIAHRYIEHVRVLLLNMESLNKLSRVKWRPVSLNPSDAAH